MRDGHFLRISDDHMSDDRPNDGVFVYRPPVRHARGQKKRGEGRGLSWQGK